MAAVNTGVVDAAACQAQMLYVLRSVMQPTFINHTHFGSCVVGLPDTAECGLTWHGL